MDEYTLQPTTVLTAAEVEFGKEFARAKMESITRGVVILQLQEQIDSLQRLADSLQAKLDEGENHGG